MSQYECHPSCQVPGCAKNHGPVCSDGAMCPKRQEGRCHLYHKIRARGKKLDETSAEFHPQNSSSQTTPAAQTSTTTTAKQSTAAHQLSSSTVKADAASVIALNATAKPFTPLPSTVAALDKHDITNTDVDYYTDDETEFEDEDEDEDLEFSNLVDSLRADPAYSAATEEEIEALANEMFYSRRTPMMVQKEQPQEQPPAPQPTSAAVNILSHLAQPFIPSPKPLPQTQVEVTIVPAQTNPEQEGDFCACCGGFPVECEGSTVCLSRGICVCVDDEVDHAKLATWVVSSRLCPCCEGFVYRCKHKAPTCKAECDCKGVKALVQ